MSTFTSTSRIKTKADVTSTVAVPLNPCKTHGIQPTVYVITWGKKKHQRGATAECYSDDCTCFEFCVPDVVAKWNDLNPREEASA